MNHSSNMCADLQKWFKTLKESWGVYFCTYASLYYNIKVGHYGKWVSIFQYINDVIYGQRLPGNDQIWNFQICNSFRDLAHLRFQSNKYMNCHPQAMRERDNNGFSLWHGFRLFLLLSLLFLTSLLLCRRHSLLPFQRMSNEANELVGDWHRPGADAIKKFTPSLGIPYLGV